MDGGLRIMSKIRVFAEMIKFEHTIFALPFAYLGAFFAAKYDGVGSDYPTLMQFLWITLAMVGARTAAMSLNRLIDRHIDARNPRTKDRAIPKGLISIGEVWLYIVLSFSLLIFAAAQLNPLCLKLMPVAVFLLVIYSYTKRFTWACHLVLGLAIGAAPAGSWVGITGSLDLPAILLWLGVGAWVAGFDVIYACQDYEFDKDSELYSIPSRFGLEQALRIAKFLHLLAAAFLVWVAFVLPVGLLYTVGVLLAIVIMYYEHTMVSPKDLSKLNAAFFNMNGILSVLMFVFAMADILFPIKVF